MAKRGPQYKLKDLISACGEPEKVRVDYVALKTARACFQLLDREQILESVNKNLERMMHQNTKLLQVRQKLEKPPWVDAYSFYLDRDFGYLAFYFHEDDQKWVIKSFKENDGMAVKAIQNQVTETAMGAAFRKASLEKMKG